MREPRLPWTSRAVRDFCNEYPYTPNDVLAEKYGRTREAINRMAQKYKMHKVTVEDLIRERLKNSAEPVKTCDLAKAAGREEIRAINYALRKMLANGDVRKVKHGYWEWGNDSSIRANDSHHGALRQPPAGGTIRTGMGRGITA